MLQALALLPQLAGYASAGMQIFQTVQAALEVIAKASSEGRDLTDAEVATIKADMGAAEDAWKALAPKTPD